MAENNDSKSLTEAVGVFDDANQFEAAIDELQSNGFDRAELSLLASEETIDQELGHLYKRVEELEDDPDTPRAAYVSKESLGDAEGGVIGGLFYIGALAGAGAVIASSGPLLAAITAAGIFGGAGGLIGSMLAKLIEDHHAHEIQEHLDHGGLVLWVRTRDKEHEARARQILEKHSAHDVHIHALAEAKG